MVRQGLELELSEREEDLQFSWRRMRMLSVAQCTASWAKCWFRAMRLGEWRMCL